MEHRCDASLFGARFLGFQLAGFDLKRTVPLFIDLQLNVALHTRIYEWMLKI